MHIFALAIPISTFLAITALLGTAGDLEVWGQSNATGSAAGRTADGILANMTSNDFQPLQDFMNEALGALNDANNQLSELSNRSSDDTEESDE